MRQRSKRRYSEFRRVYDNLVILFSTEDADPRKLRMFKKDLIEYMLISELRLTGLMYSNELEHKRIRLMTDNKDDLVHLNNTGFVTSVVNEIYDTIPRDMEVTDISCPNFHTVRVRLSEVF